MPRQGKPENFNNPESQGLTEQLNIKVTPQMKEEVKAQDNPAQFCRDAIQRALDEQKKLDT